MGTGTELCVCLLSNLKQHRAGDGISKENSHRSHNNNNNEDDDADNFFKKKGSSAPAEDASIESVDSSKAAALAAAQATVSSFLTSDPAEWDKDDEVRSRLINWITD